MESSNILENDLRIKHFYEEQIRLQEKRSLHFLEGKRLSMESNFAVFVI